MPEDRITLRQLLALTFAALLSPAVQILPGETALRAGEGAWLSALAALPAALAGWWALCALLRRGKELRGLPRAACDLLGPAAGRGLCLVYLLWGLFLLAANARLAALRFLTISYRNASLSLFALILLGVAFWLARKPAGALARAGEVFFLALTVGLALTLALGAFQIRAVNLLPVWTEDLPGLASAALPVLGLLGYGVFAACLAGPVEPEEGGRRKALRWGVGLCLTLTALQAVCLGGFGPGLVARLDTPFFMMAKAIGFEGTFQRVESLVIALWVLSDLALLALLTAACDRLARQTFALREGRSAALPVALAAGAGALWLFPDAFFLDDLLNSALLWGNLLLGLVLPAALVVVKLWREQK